LGEKERAMPHFRSGLAIAACGLCLGGCSHPSGAPAQQATVSAPSRVRVRATPAPAATIARATPIPTPAPSATPAAAVVVRVAAPRTSRVPNLPPDAAPQILSVAISRHAVQPGDRVTGNVLTSSNVASVEARIGGYAVTLDKVGVGRFTFTYTVGPLPWFIHGDYTMQVIARNTRGDAARRSIPLTVR
jgi:hypothetical protein